MESRIMKRNNRAVIQRRQSDLTESERICKILLKPQDLLGCEVGSPQTLPDDQYYQVIAAVCKRILILFESQKQTCTEGRGDEPLYINAIIIDAFQQHGRLTKDQRQRVIAWFRDPRFSLFSAALSYWTSSHTSQLLYLFGDHFRQEQEEVIQFNQTWLMITLTALMLAISGNYATTGHMSNDLLGCANQWQPKWVKRSNFQEFHRNLSNLDIVYRRLNSRGQLITSAFKPLEDISEDFLRDKVLWQSMHQVTHDIVKAHTYNPEVRVSRAIMDIYLTYTQPYNRIELASCIYEQLFGIHNNVTRFIAPEDQAQQIKAFFKTAMVTLHYLTISKPHEQSDIRIRDYFAGAPKEVFKTINSEIQKERFFSSIYSFLLSLVDEDVSNLDTFVEHIYVIYAGHQEKVNDLNSDYQRATKTVGTDETASMTTEREFVTKKRQLRSEFLSCHKLQQLQANSDCSEDIEQFEDQMVTIVRQYRQDLQKLNDEFRSNTINATELAKRKQHITTELKNAKLEICRRYPIAAMKEFESDKRNIEKGYQADLEQLQKFGIKETQMQEQQKMEQQLIEQLQDLRAHYCIDDISGSQHSNSSLFIFTDSDFQNTSIEDALVIIRTQMIDHKNLQFGDWAARHNCLRKHSDYYKHGVAQDRVMQQREVGVDYERMLRDIDERNYPSKRLQRLAEESASRWKVARYILSVTAGIVGVAALTVLTVVSLGAALPFALPLSTALFAAISTGLTALGIFGVLRNDQSRWNRIKAWVTPNMKVTSAPATVLRRPRARTLSNAVKHNLPRATSTSTVAQPQPHSRSSAHFPATQEGAHGLRLFKKSHSATNLAQLAQQGKVESIQELASSVSSF